MDDQERKARAMADSFATISPVKAEVLGAVKASYREKEAESLFGARSSISEVMLRLGMAIESEEWFLKAVTTWLVGKLGSESPPQEAVAWYCHRLMSAVECAQDNKELLVALKMMGEVLGMDRRYVVSAAKGITGMMQQFPKVAFKKVGP